MILVTGATGFLGSFICKKLIDEGESVIGLKRVDSNTDLLTGYTDKITWHEGDILVPDSIEAILPKVKVIIHSAALVSFDPKERSLMKDINIEGTKNMVDLSLKYNIKYFIHISSVAAIGRNGTASVVDETNKWQQSKLNTHYGESKYLAELEVWRGIVEGLKAFIVNPSVIIGPGDWNRSSSKIFKYIWDEKKFYTDGLVNYVDVRDVANIIYTLMCKDIEGERYIINAGSVSYKTFFQNVAKDFGKKAPSIRATSFMIKMAVLSEKLKSILRNSSPIVTTETARVSQSQIYFDNQKLLKELNYSFRSLSNTISWTCAEFLQIKK